MMVLRHFNLHKGCKELTVPCSVLSCVIYSAFISQSVHKSSKMMMMMKAIQRTKWPLRLAGNYDGQNPQSWKGNCASNSAWLADHLFCIPTFISRLQKDSE